MRYYCAMKKYFISLTLILSLFVPLLVNAQQSSLRDQITRIAGGVKGIVGVSILNEETRDTVSLNGQSPLVMQSVMKFPIALAVLHWVDTGKLSLDQTIKVRRHELNKTYSPLRDKYPDGGEFRLDTLLSYMVSKSDNNACDILLKKLDGPQTVQRYLLQLGIRGIAVRASEQDMASAWELQFTNWSKPIEMTRLLDLFYQGKLLSPKNTAFLMSLMEATTTGPNRLKGLLPAGTTVAHKTGSSGTSPEGLTPATNDVGIITLPNDKHIIISVFVCNSPDNEATRESAIAKIARAAYDYYNR